MFYAVLFPFSLLCFIRVSVVWRVSHKYLSNEFTFFIVGFPCTNCAGGPNSSGSGVLSRQPTHRSSKQLKDYTKKIRNNEIFWPFKIKNFFLLVSLLPDTMCNKTNEGSITPTTFLNYFHFSHNRKYHLNLGYCQFQKKSRGELF